MKKADQSDRYFVRVSLVRQYSNIGSRVLGAHIGTVHRSSDCVYLRGQPHGGSFDGDSLGKGDWLNIDLVDRAIVRIRGSIVESLPHCQKCCGAP